jgi:hypothetical protein
VEAQSSQPVRPPSVGPNPIHRTTYLVLGVALLVALAIAAGVAALVAAGNDEQTPPTPTTTVAAAARTLAAAEANVSNSTLSVKTSAGWKVINNSKYSIDLTNSGAAGILGFLSGPFKGTLVQFAQGEVAYLSKAGLKNVKVCGKAVATKVPNGPAGALVTVCGVIVGQNRQAIPVFWFGWLGVAGGAAFETKVITPASKAGLNKFLTPAAQVIKTVHWKLFRGV